jgi:hypothetical protein
MFTRLLPLLILPKPITAMKVPRKPFTWLLGSLLVGLLFVWSWPSPVLARLPITDYQLPITNYQSPPSILSPIWGTDIQQWSAHIAVLSDVYGLDPDFIAAIIKEESNGRADLVSEAGAVGLMGVMPSGPGLEWRPPTEELQNPAVNLRWGVGILAEVVRQAGGDLFAALAAYSGGWEQANNRVPRAYGARVLDNYGRAIVARTGQSPEIASQWTIAIEISRGYVPNQPLLVLGEQPQSGLHLFGKHVIFNDVDADGKAYYIIGYAVPIELLTPSNLEGEALLVSQNREIQLSNQSPNLVQPTGEKTASSNEHVILACLPSLERLRGQNSTRWFAPSQCPSANR